MYYQIQESLQDNVISFHHWPKHDFRHVWPERTKWQNFLGYPLAVPVGVSACPIAMGEGIRHLARYGYGVLTYKTIRYHASPPYPAPNIFYINEARPLKEEDLTLSLQGSLQPPPDKEYLGLTNSFGNGNLDPLWLEEDIANTKQQLLSGQVLSVSIYGEETANITCLQSFIDTAILAKQAGADSIELNLSCPNIQKSLHLNQMDIINDIAQATVKAVAPLPVIAKIAYQSDKEKTRLLLIMLAQAGIRAITAINTIPVQVLNSQRQPIFGDRIISGLSGYPIRNLALNFIRLLTEINNKEKLDLVILGVGGITTAEDFNLYFEAGADVALSATAIMSNPLLIKEYLHASLSKEIA